MLELPLAGVHLWLAFADDARDPDLLRAYRDLLTPQEQERGERFRFDVHREQYWLTRALVRTVLSKYLPLPPQDWRFEANEYGRPHAANPQAVAQGVSFNLSHTDGLVVLAVAQGRAVGVDVERSDRKVSLNLADHYFAPAEAAALRALPPSLQHDRFLDLWTLKESYIKARGMGLSIPLDRFGFDHDGGDIALRLAPEVEDDASRWRFLRWRPSPDHVAALCLEHPAAAPPPRTTARRVVPLRSERLIGDPWRDRV